MSGHPMARIPQISRGPEAPPKEVMAHRLKTAAGKALYKLRKQTVEPKFS
jgi:hypothetical protein